MSAKNREITDPSDYVIDVQGFKDTCASDDAQFKAELLAEVICRKHMDMTIGLLDAKADLKRDVQRIAVQDGVPEYVTVTPLLLAAAVNDRYINHVVKIVLRRTSELECENYDLLIKTHQAIVGAPKPVSTAGSQAAFTSNMHKDPQIGQGAGASAEKPPAPESQGKKGCVIF